MKLVQLLLLFLSFHAIHGSNSTDDRKHYIIYMGSHSFPDSESLISANHDMLSLVTGSHEEARRATIYHYHRSFRGFSAMLTPQQAEQISKTEPVISVFENQFGQLNTMRSWDFIGATAKSIFSLQANRKDYDVIVGHFDSGIWPESPSFREDGLGPVPKRWKGQCTEPSCNRKIIGTRWYSRGYTQQYGPLESSGRRHYLSTRDDFGHGTHTASTAVGSSIKNVTFKGMGSHEVRGGAPGARIAVYKICWNNFCTCADGLKAYDDAIADGVDLITISVGHPVSNNIPDFMDDCLSIGALHAFQRGILVSSSGGNDGAVETVENAAPWMLTVGATSIDREFVSPLQLGNSLTLRGHAYNYQDMDGYHEVIYARTAALPWVSADEASACEQNTLDSRVIRGKIVICTVEIPDAERLSKSDAVRNGGGVGAIIVDPYGKLDFATMDFLIPTTVIDNQEDAQKLYAYMTSPNNPTAFIHPYNAQLNIKPAPRMANFSSKGPGSAPDIIKPDITAPGLNIIASYPAWDEEDKSTPRFEIDSGTSMACPHASGVAAIVKATHPKWSPAAIKSALMTTATHLDNTGNPIKSGEENAVPFEMGSGQLNPTGALNPGLIYDYNMNDLVAYLCNGVSPSQLKNLMGADWVWCSDPAVPTYNLNYPSISISDLRYPTIVTRTVTYVGHAGDPKKFHVEIENPEGIYLEVEPRVLDFSGGEKTATFRVKVQAWERLGTYVFGSIRWFNDVHSVRSPVAVRAF